MIPIEFNCHELKRLTDDYYKCDSPEIKELINNHMKLLSEALFLSDLPDE